jgi:hypothetical protein
MENIKKKKTFVGSGIEVGEYKYIAAGMAIEDVTPFAKKAANGKHYFNILIGKKKEKDQYGKTHWVAIDEWEKKSTEEKEQEKLKEKELEQYGPVVGCSISGCKEENEINVNDIPF